MGLPLQDEEEVPNWVKNLIILGRAMKLDNNRLIQEFLGALSVSFVDCT